MNLELIVGIFQDTFVKLGLTPINADLLLSNCADASGLVRDVQRAKNFMEAFLAKKWVDYLLFNLLTTLNLFSFVFCVKIRILC